MARSTGSARVRLSSAPVASIEEDLMEMALPSSLRIQDLFRGISCVSASEKESETVLPLTVAEEIDGGVSSELVLVAVVENEERSVPLGVCRTPED